MRNLLFLLCLTAIYGCNISKGKEATGFENFSTDESSKLYFKNVRRAYYDITVLEEAKLETYRLKKRVQSDDKPVLNLAIVNNWRFDEAYVLLEPNNQFSGMGNIRVRWKTEGIYNEVAFANTNKESHVSFADKVYAIVDKDISLETWIGNEWIPFLNDASAKEAFRTTMYDYYRLVRRL